MTVLKPKTMANAGYAKILETIVAAAIIFIVFAASSFFVNSSQIKAVQERTDLDRLGYNVLSRLTESGVIEATIDKEPLFAAFASIIHILQSYHNEMVSRSKRMGKPSVTQQY
jgi:hypothetical protein